jgi:hypothetical protein
MKHFKGIGRIEKASDFQKVPRHYPLVLQLRSSITDTHGAFALLLLLDFKFVNN